jgi:hypothetical protein
MAKQWWEQDSLADDVENNWWSQDPVVTPEAEQSPQQPVSAQATTLEPVAETPLQTAFNLAGGFDRSASPIDSAVRKEQIARPPAPTQPATTEPAPKELPALGSWEQTEGNRIKQKFMRVANELASDVGYKNLFSKELSELDQKNYENKQAFDQLIREENPLLLQTVAPETVTEPVQPTSTLQDFAGATKASILNTVSGLMSVPREVINQVIESESQAKHLSSGVFFQELPSGDVKTNYVKQQVDLLTKGPIQKYFDEQAKLNMPALSDATWREALEQDKLGTWIGVQTLNQTPQLAMMITGAVTRNPNIINQSLNVMGASAAGRTYDELIDDGIPHVDAVVMSAISGVLEKATEKMQLEKLVDVAKNAFSKKIATDYLNTVTSAVTKTIGVGSATEYVEEFSNEIASDELNRRVAENALRNDPNNKALQRIVNKPLSETIAEAHNAGVAGLVVGGTLGASFAYGAARQAIDETKTPEQRSADVLTQALDAPVDFIDGADRVVAETLRREGMYTPAATPATDQVTGLASGGISLGDGTINFTPDTNLTAQAGLTPIVMPDPATTALPMETSEVDSLVGSDIPSGFTVPEFLDINLGDTQAVGEGVVIEEWLSRSGDGFKTERGAQGSLEVRQRMFPELNWQVEEMPNGKYRLAGYSAETVGDQSQLINLREQDGQMQGQGRGQTQVAPEATPEMELPVGSVTGRDFINNPAIRETAQVVTFNNASELGAAKVGVLKELGSKFERQDLSNGNVAFIRIQEEPSGTQTIETQQAETQGSQAAATIGDRITELSKTQEPLSESVVADLSRSPYANEQRARTQKYLNDLVQKGYIEEAPTLNAPDAEAELSINVMGNVLGEGLGIGNRVVAYSDPEGANGFAVQGIAFVNTFIDGDSMDVPSTTLHEIYHVAESLARAGQAPAIQFVSDMNTIFDDMTEAGKRDYVEKFLFKEELNKLYNPATGEGNAKARQDKLVELMQSETLQSEMIADFLGNRAQDREFLLDLAATDPQGFEGFVRKWLSIIDNLIQKLRGGPTQSQKQSTKVDLYVKDLNKAKMVARDALIAFRKGNIEASSVTETKDDGVPRSARETDDIGARLQDRVDNNFDALVSEYNALPMAEGGKVLDADVSRELSPEYRQDRNRASEVHNATSQFVQKLFNQRMAQPHDGGFVVMMAGGGGAGKSSANILLSDTLQDADTILDGTLSTYTKAKRNIQTALDSGRGVKIAYVYRDPIEALRNGVLPRAMKTGRTVPIDALVRGHAGSSETVRRLAEEFSGNPDVEILAIDNSQGAGNATIKNLTDITTVIQSDLKERLLDATREEFEAGRISEPVYQSTVGDTRVADEVAREDAQVDEGDQREVQQRAEPSRSGDTLADFKPTSAELGVDGIAYSAKERNLVDIPTISIADLEDKRVFGIKADLTDAGRSYTGIDGSQLTYPIEMLGGPNYVRLPENVKANVVWAVRGGGTLEKILNQVKKTDYVLVHAMNNNSHLTNTTVSTAYLQTVEAYLRDGRIAQNDLEKLNAIVRSPSNKQSLPDFPGFDSSDIYNYIDNLSFDQRGALAKILEKKESQKFGLPNLERFRRETIDPEFVGYRQGDAMLAIEVDKENPVVRLGEDGTKMHPSYPLGIKGKVIGKFDKGINYETIFRDYFNFAVPNFKNKEAGAWYAFDRVLPVQRVTQDIVNSVSSGEFSAIRTARQAEAALAFANSDWLVSGKTKAEGGVSVQEFVDALKANEGAAALTLYTEQEVKAGIKDKSFTVYQLGNQGGDKGMQIFFGLKRGAPWYADMIDGVSDSEVEVVSVTNNETGAPGIGMPSIMTKAIAEGATILDAFAVKSSRFSEGFLPEMYAQFGFEEIGRIPFDPSYYDANALADLKQFWSRGGWSEADGAPDVVVMKWRGNDEDRRTAITRYVREGITSVSRQPVGDVRGAAKEFIQQRDGQSVEETRSGSIDSGQARGDQRVSDAAPLVTRAYGIIQELASLGAGDIRNLGLNPSDVQRLRDQLERPAYSRRERDVARLTEPVRGSSARPDARPRPNTITGIHYGQKAGLSQLRGSAFGTGIKGAEQERLSGSNVDPRIKRRVYFYVATNDAILPQPEVGLGTHVYRATLSNMYDASTASTLDKQRIADLRTDTSANAFESAVLDAGYQGYVNRDNNIAVVLNANVPVAYEGIVDPSKVETRTAQAQTATGTRVIKDELVRRPTSSEMLDIIRTRSSLQEVAPSFALANGEARVNQFEATLANDFFEDNGIDFRFDVPAISESKRERDSVELDQDGLIKENPRLSSFDIGLKRGVNVLGLFESATDKLRRSGSPILKEMATRVDRYFDQVEARNGKFNGRLRPALRNLQKGDLQDFEQFWKDYDNGRQAQANKMLAANPRLAKLVSAVRDSFDEAGIENQRVGVKVFDAKTQEWRLIGRSKDFWPRVIRPEIARELQSGGTTNPELWNEMLEALMADGKIESKEEASKYIRNYFTNESSNDYFAGIEKARGDKLPEMFYDYSWEVVPSYAHRWAQRLSQIENFGQVTGANTKDFFDKVKAKTLDPTTAEYINAIQQRVYDVRQNSTSNKIMANLNMYATGTQLGNPATATLNLIGGTQLNVQMFGYQNVTKALAELARDYDAIMQEGTELGILGKDTLSLMKDHEVNQSEYLSDVDRLSQGLRGFTSFTMKWGGYNATEQLIRATAFVSAKGQLNDALNVWANDPTGSDAGKYNAFMERNRIDKDALIREQGIGEETAKYLRLMVNIPQGSYKIDQTPIYVDTPAGRFFFKYQKFGTQVSRMFWEQNLQPMLDAMSGKSEESRVDAFTRLIRWFATAGLGGTLVLAARSALFGALDAGPDREELEEALKSDDNGFKMMLLFERAWTSLMAGSAFGFFGNYAQMTKDVYDQQRVKDPLSPPALAPIITIKEAILRLLEQGKLTARDIDDLATQSLAIYRSNKRLAASGAQVLELEIDELQLEQARRDVSYVRKVARWYAKDAGLEGKVSTSTRFGMTENTPVNRKIHEAILLNDPDKALDLALQEYDRLDDPEEWKKRRQSIMSALSNRHPARISQLGNQEARKAFEEWVEDKMPQSKQDKLFTIIDNYEANTEFLKDAMP